MKFQVGDRVREGHSEDTPKMTVIDYTFEGPVLKYFCGSNPDELREIAARRTLAKLYLSLEPARDLALNSEVLKAVRESGKEAGIQFVVPADPSSSLVLTDGMDFKKIGARIAGTDGPFSRVPTPEDDQKAQGFFEEAKSFLESAGYKVSGDHKEFHVFNQGKDLGAGFTTHNYVSLSTALADALPPDLVEKILSGIG